MEDINQHFEQLRRLLVKIGYPHSVDKERICAGITTELLPLLHYGLLSHSKCLSAFISDLGYSLYRQNDLKFTEGIYKLLRKEFKYNPVLQCQQFLTDKGFAKRKIQFVVTCLKLGISKHNQLLKEKKLSSQPKISWKQTNLAKKIEKLNAEKNNNKKPIKITKKKIVIKSVQSINNKPVKPPKSIIPKKITIENPIDDTEEDEDDDNDQIENENNMNDDSLTVDEIRNNLPKPIMINAVNHDFTNEDNEESENENKENEEEEKAMELKQEHEEHEEEVNQSIQIPQYKYDMQLIPEYDPEKYASPKQEKVDVVKDGKDDDEEVMRTNEHYSGSYLDTYTDLMDIPYDDEDDEHGNDNGGDGDVNKDNSEKERDNPDSLQIFEQLINMGFNEDLAIIASNKYPNDMNKAITFITLTSQQEQQESNANKIEVNDENENEQDNQDEIGEEFKNEDEKENDKNSIISFMKQMDKKFDAFSKDLKAHIDDKCFLLEKRIETLERTNSKFEEKLKSQQERIEALENINTNNNNIKTTPSFNNNQSRTSSGYTIPSNTVLPRKSIEETSNKDSSSIITPSQQKSIIPSLTSKPSQPAFIHKSILSPSPFPTNTSFTDSTIGSSALGMSVTPNPTRTSSVLLNGNGIRTQPRIGMTTNNRNIISGQLRTTQSPFIGTQSYNYSQYQPLQPNVTHVTGGVNSGGGGNMDIRSDPDNTMEFIADLKRMLNSTDALLKSNREERNGLGLYDANI